MEAPSLHDDSHKRIKLTAGELSLERTPIIEDTEDHTDEESDSEIDVFRNIRVNQNAIHRGQLLEEYIKSYRRLPRKRQMMFRNRMEMALFERGYLSEQINRALNQEPFSSNVPPFSGSFSRSHLEGHVSQIHTTPGEDEEVKVP